MKKLFCFIFSFFILTGCSNISTNENAIMNVSTQNLYDKKQGWGFKKIEGESPQFTKEQIETMEKYNCIYLGKDEKSIYLTFDEGYENGYTAPILDVLKKHGVPAAFFITGDYFEKNEDLIKRMLDEGHIVGNHTLNHPSLPDKSAEEIQNETEGLNDKFYKKFGIKMKYVRPPMGEYSEKSLEITKNLGYANVFWSFAYKDWEVDNQKGKENTLSQIKRFLHGGAVILLHAVSKDNAEAMEEIITYARKMGFEFKSLDEYK